MTQPLVQRLRDAAGTLPAHPISMGALAQAHGSDASGALLLLMAAPCILPVPGVGTVLGLGMAALAVALWRGKAGTCLPGRVADLKISRQCAQRVLLLLASTYAMAGRHTKIRMSRFAPSEGRSGTVFVIGLMAVIVVLPIPFGNLLPAIALALIGVGMVFRDGLAVILGLAMAGLALVVTAGLAFATYALASKGVTALF
ncbi:MAG: exopolysaccharide biosynthesis protein [Pseudomonadota bacterium]